MIDRSEVRYAVADGHHIAYRVLTGDPDGSHDVVMCSGGVFPMDALPEDPLANRLLEGLASLGRLVVFDKRGVGLSDQISDWERSRTETWGEDLAAVIDAAGLRRPVLFSWMALPVARRHALLHPDGVSALVLWNVNTPADPDEWDQEATQAVFEAARKGPVVSELLFPERWKDPVFREWHDAAGRAGASPTQAARLQWNEPEELEIDCSGLSVPTLVLARRPPQMPFPLPEDYFRRPARLIPGAELVDLGEGSHNPFGLGVDEVLAEITRFVTGEARLPHPERSLAAILLTDLVGSTRRAAEVGDRAWKALLGQHDQISAAITDRHGGEVVKSTGDGMLALFGSTSAAVAAARALASRLDELGLPVRLGIHAGQVDRRGDDVSGLAVHVAARIMAAAGAGQVLVSDVVERITDDVAFTLVDERALAGVPGTWGIYEVSGGA